MTSNCKKNYFFDFIAIINNYIFEKHTVVGDNTITMKTTFNLNFDLYEAVKQLVKNKNRSQEKLLI